MTSYEALEAHFGRIARLREAAAVLHWDRATMMPAGGAAGRTEQVAALRATIHERMTDPRVDAWLGEAESELDGRTEDDLAGWRKANLREMRRSWLHATALSTDLVDRMSRAESACEMAWREARPANDFARVVPLLDQVVRLAREKAAAKGARFGVDPYDALLDEFDPGGRTERIDALFTELLEFLPALVERALEHQSRKSPALPPTGPFPIARQRDVAERLMKTLGFDFAHGRLDVSHHPFCGGTPDDARITTRYVESDFLRSMMAVVHETGHALYESGRPAEWRYQPVGAALGMSLHESQSLLVEMQVCRSREFLTFVAPILREAFQGVGPPWSADNLLRLCTRVERGLIRVDADEVTYPLHVILRYRLEQALLRGDLMTADLPAAWNESMLELVGVRPPDDRDGCMQDIHWFDGAFGYFPTYTLGALTAAQLFATAKDAVPDLWPSVERGDVRPLLGWLRANVHGWGRRFGTEEMVVHATGRPLEVAPFRRHVERRYLEQSA